MLKQAMFRELALQNKFEHELKLIVTHFDRKMALTTKQNSKTFKQLSNTQRIFSILQFSSDIEDLKLNVIRKFKEIMRAFYMLDYIIWCHQQLKYQIEELEEETGSQINNDPRYPQMASQMKIYIRKIKDWRDKIQTLEESLFKNTDLVDKERLYQIKEDTATQRKDDSSSLLLVPGVVPGTPDELSSSRRGRGNTVKKKGKKKKNKAEELAIE